MSVLKFIKSNYLGILGSIGSTFILMYQEEIKYSIKYLFDGISKILYCSYEIKLENDSRCFIAMKCFIQDYFNQNKNNCSNFILKNSYDLPSYEIANGHYSVIFENETYNFYIENNYILIYQILGYVNKIEYFISSIYDKYFYKEELVLIFNSNNDHWNEPIIRRKINNRKITNEMKLFLNDAYEFIDSEKEYYDNGHPFKKGYLLVGEPCSGKTTCCDILATEKNMDIYQLLLNSDKMDDSKLIQLVSLVPPKSIILIDEFEGEFENIKNNKNNLITKKGLLKALDGIQRISHGTIIVLTANNIDNIDKEYKNQLIRPGRIDMIFDKFKA